MSVHVFLNLLNELGERANGFKKSIIQEHKFKILLIICH